MKTSKAIKGLLTVGIMALATSSLMFISNGCKKTETATPSSSSSPMTVMLTDAPASYDQVNIEVLKVEAKIISKDESDENAIKSESETLNHDINNDVDYDVNHNGISDDVETEVHDMDHDAHWVQLNTHVGIYDLLKLRNNVATVLAENKGLPVGKVTQLRLIVGTQNTVVVGGQVFKLFVPGGFQTGIKILVREVLNLNGNGQGLTIKLDFNADKSIILTDDGRYILKPVIKIAKNEPPVSPL